MRVKFINERALAPMLRTVKWVQDAEPHKSGTFQAQVLEGESQSPAAGPSLDGLNANPWTIRVPTVNGQNPLAALVKMGDELTVAPGVKLIAQQTTQALDGYIIIRATADVRAPIN